MFNVYTHIYIRIVIKVIYFSQCVFEVKSVLFIYWNADITLSICSAAGGERSDPIEWTSVQFG